MNITIEQIAGFATAVVIIYKAIDMIIDKLFGSSKEDIKKLKKENECRVTEIKEVKKTLVSLETTSNITLQSLFALIDHEIDGNGKENMKRVRDQLREQIIKK